jgi:hypothetical protein
MANEKKKQDAADETFQEFLGNLSVGTALDRQQHEAVASASGKFRKLSRTIYEFKGAQYEVPANADRFLAFCYVVLYLARGGVGEYWEPPALTAEDLKDL